MRRYLIYFPLLFLTVSCEIIEEDISGRAVTTIAPADDAEVPAGETLFRWRAVDRATGYEFKFYQIDFQPKEAKTKASSVD